MPEGVFAPPPLNRVKSHVIQFGPSQDLPYNTKLYLCQPLDPPHFIAEYLNIYSAKVSKNYLVLHIYELASLSYFGFENGTTK